MLADLHDQIRCSTQRWRSRQVVDFFETLPTQTALVEGTPSEALLLALTIAVEL
jgi:hypothetical protein